MVLFYEKRSSRIFGRHPEVRSAAQLRRWLARLEDEPRIPFRVVLEAR
jgi:hypothetical protein